MDISAILDWSHDNVALAILLFIFLNFLIFLFTRNILARGLMNLSAHTKTKIDDILVRHLQPFRIAWLAPLGLTLAAAPLLPTYQDLIRKFTLFLIMWVVVATITALLNALNDIYESRPGFTGVSIQSYMDIAKILIVIVAIILSISLLSGESPIVLLTGLGALTAVLLLIFQDTILSLVASIQIVAHDLIKEGDWIEVPSYGADGDVINISLHAIKVQNFDKTLTVIPTYKIVDVAYKNWRGMQESGGRRIQRSLLIDMNTVKFCDESMLQRLRRIDRIQEYIDERIQSIAAYQTSHPERLNSPLDGPQVTNLEAFRTYITALLKERTDIHQEGMPFLVRTLAPNPTGLPVEIYIFAKTIRWEEFEGIQAEIFDHLLGAAGHFDLRLFQEPTGLDFSAFARTVSATN